MRATQSNCCGSLNFLSPEPCPQQPWAARIITRFRQSYSSVIMSREWKTLKKSRSDWLDCTDTAVEWKMRLLCFPVLPGSAEAHVIWGGTVKHVLIACFISNICAKKYQNTFTCIKVIANQRWDVFWDTVYNCIYNTLRFSVRSFSCCFLFICGSVGWVLHVVQISACSYQMEYMRDLILDSI